MGGRTKPLSEDALRDYTAGKIAENAPKSTPPKPAKSVTGGIDDAAETE